MDFVKRDSGSDVALTMAINRTSLEVVPPHVYFSGAALGRVKGHKGSCVLVTTPSQVVIFGKGQAQVWSAPIESVSAVAEGRGELRLSYDGNSVDFATGLSSPKKLLAHLSMAKEVVEQSEEIVRQLKRLDSESVHLNVSDVAHLRNKGEVDTAPTSQTGYMQQQRAAAASESDQHGELVLDEIFCGKAIRLYSNGYVRISGLRGGPIERLTGISATGDVSKKTAVGRVAVASVTAGANLFLSGNKRGELYLAISTDKQTHMLSKPVGGNDKEIAKMYKIAAAGQAILDALSRGARETVVPVQTAQVVATPSVADQLDRLVEMNKSGLLSDEEFKQAKARLLSS